MSFSTGDFFGYFKAVISKSEAIQKFPDRVYWLAAREGLLSGRRVPLLVRKRDMRYTYVLQIPPSP